MHDEEILYCKRCVGTESTDALFILYVIRSYSAASRRVAGDCVLNCVCLCVIVLVSKISQKLIYGALPN